MKKLATLLFLLLSALHLAAQSERFPFVEEGKTWIVQFGFYGSYDDPSEVTYSTYELRGDTLINDTLCKKMYTWEVDSKFKPLSRKKYAAALFEHNQQVYICKPDSMFFMLLFDLNVQIGDVRLIGSGVHDNFESYPSSLRPIQITNISTWAGDPQRKEYNFQIGNGTSEDFHFYAAYPYKWVEGIGSTAVPHYTWMHNYTGGFSPRLVKCFVDNNPNSIQSIDHFKVVPTHRKGMFSIDGRRLNNPPERGVYILDGQKMVR